MKKIFLLLLILLQCSFMAIAAAEEEYPEENYKMYYEGNGMYPIAFIQWGEGYVLDGFTATRLGSDNVLVADIHPVNMETKRMSPKTMHIRVDYKPNKSFKACLQEERGLGEMPANANIFTVKKIGASTAETGMLFPAGRILWEMVHHKPFFKGQPILKPVGEAGAPALIKIREDLRYARYNQEVAWIAKEDLSMTVLFTPTYFILQEYHTSDDKLKAKLEALVGKMSAYESNADIALVREYMGVPRP